MEWLEICTAQNLRQSQSRQSRLHQYTLQASDAALYEMLQVAHATLCAPAAVCVLAAMCNRQLIRPERLWPWIISRPESMPWHSFEEAVVARHQRAHGPAATVAYRACLADLLLSHRVPHHLPFLDDDCSDARRLKRGSLWRTLRRRAQKRWSLVAAACVAVAMWRRWEACMCAPGSGYITRVVQRRFEAHAASVRHCFNNWAAVPS